MSIDRPLEMVLSGEQSDLFGNSIPTQAEVFREYAGRCFLNRDTLISMLRASSDADEEIADLIARLEVDVQRGTLVLPCTPPEFVRWLRTFRIPPNLEPFVAPIEREATHRAASTSGGEIVVPVAAYDYDEELQREAEELAKKLKRPGHPVRKKKVAAELAKKLGMKAATIERRTRARGRAAFSRALH